MGALSLLKTASKAVGVLPGLKHRKKRLAAAVGALIVACLVNWGVPPEIAQALGDVGAVLVAE